MQDAATVTPMFRQYRALKGENPGAILLFRMGDFYEMFFEDAEVASKTLELTLTARGKGTANVAPMCGFPHHQLDGYAARLVRSGHRVAVCEQVEDPKTAKGLVRREVVRVVTPGTIDDPGVVPPHANVWIAATAAFDRRVGAAFLDASTGEFLAWEADGPGAWEAWRERMEAFGPREIVRPDDLAWPENARGAVDCPDSPIDAYPFGPSVAGEILKRHFSVASLDGYGLSAKPAATAAAGGLLTYVRDTMRSGLAHVDGLAYHDPALHLVIDAASARNLEIERSLRDGARAGSLVGAVDRTVTAPGARLLRSWLAAPLRDPAAIRERHEAVEELAVHPRLRAEVRSALDGTHDIERLLARAVAGTAGARDLLALAASLERLPALVGALAPASSPLLREIAAADPCAAIALRLRSGLADDPPAGLREGGLIKDGHDVELDELRAIRRDGRESIAAIETQEREASGIASLKVRYNRIFGYSIEVSKANLHLVPPHYERKQTIAGGERFVTADLKSYEAKVLGAQERIEGLEYELFVALRQEAAAAAHPQKAAARAAARADAIASFAELAVERDYRRPRLVTGPSLTIVGGRHPVVEQTLMDGPFTPNDTRLEEGGGAIAILTGPNMGGKSTYLRQVALIVLLAQSGSFVPAEDAEIGLVDRIFCRVGASDNLAEGQSTFMVEMAETANILHHAGPGSLVLLDEIGRGTATFDGLAIAWSVVEHLRQIPGGAPRTLFATHYHELTELASLFPDVVNLRMAVRDWGERVLFTHRVESGAADRSYGIHVARLAGVPRPVVERAAEILASLDDDGAGAARAPKSTRASWQNAAAARRKGPRLFPVEPEVGARDEDAAEILEALRLQDASRLTPLEALGLIDAWSRKLRR
ncbi:MAG TPA: DNA mismatch repair protein MutS [Candidatus Polarisedimenticolaceae bacterium]|nr:DNA mismatch repair protein MutS [Candidatus Polarisedimenticolaceae bacterium]